MYNKTQRYLISLWLLPLMVLITSCGQDSFHTRKAEKGILDAEGIFLEPSTALYLDGEWQFFPHQLIDPADIGFQHDFQYITTPGLWKPAKGSPTVTYATYRLRIVNHDLPEVFSIRNHQIYSAFALYLNGKKILANGEVGTDKESETPYYHPRTVSIHSTADTLDFVLHVSNHHYRRGGMAESFLIGNVSSLQQDYLKRSGFDHFLMGSLLIMAIYYLSLFFALRKETSSFHFSIFIFLSILRISVTGQRLLLFIFPGLPWDLMLRIEYGSFFLAPIFFTLFLKSVFKEEIKIYLINIVLAVSGLSTLLVIFTPVSFFTTLMPFYQTYTSVLAMVLIYWLIIAKINKKQGALVLLLGIIVLFSAMLHDLIQSYSSLRGRELFPAGLFLLILCQSYVLSLRFSLINKENQDLWEELDYQNQHLERLVKERTHELLEQKNLLENTNLELKQKKDTLTRQSKIMEEINELLEKEKEKTEQLLLNVLPRNIADELKTQGKSVAHSYPVVSVLFVDFVGFSKVSERLTPEQLIHELHYHFACFDDIAKKYNLEKIKTIGDAYMCAGGLREEATAQDVKNTVSAALEINLLIQSQREDKQSLDQPWLNCRIGIHTGPVIAGVVGKSKFAFDIWGPTVNIAKHMETACEPGKVNISEFTWQHIKDDFHCTSRGIISMKHKKDMQMFFVEGSKT